MTEIEILTPSYRPDLASLVRLHRSILEFAPQDAVHHVIVPARDVNLFSRLASERAIIHSVAEFLPETFWLVDRWMAAVSKVPGGRSLRRVEAINRRVLWPPVRGWIVQQLIKLSAVSRSTAQAVVVIDSDVAFIAKWSREDFVKDDSVRFYRNTAAVGVDMVRHVQWHEVAHRLLGLDKPPAPPLTDYISSLLAWDPVVVRQLLLRIQDSTGEDWATAVARNLHFSEYMLYGCFVDALGAPATRAFASDDSRCASHWDATPLDERTARELVDSVSSTDIAVLIQSTSQTAPELRHHVLNLARIRSAGLSGTHVQPD